MAPQSQRLNELLAGLSAAVQIEREHGAGALWQVFVDQRLVCATSQPCVAYALYGWVLLQIARNAECIGNVPFHAQWQGLQTEQEHERVERAHARAEVAQRLRAQLHQIAIHAEGVVESE